MFPEILYYDIKMTTHWSQLPDTIVETLTILWDSSYYCNSLSLIPQYAEAKF